MNETDLTVSGLAWLRLVAGLVVFLLPGLAAADRWLAGVPLRWVWAPVLSFTLLPLVAILLDYGLGVPIQPLVTAFLCVALAAWIGQPRLVEWAKKVRR